MNKNMLLAVLAVLMIPTAGYCLFGYHRDNDDRGRGLVGTVVGGTADIAADVTNDVADTADDLTFRRGYRYPNDVIEDEEDWSTDADAEDVEIEEEEDDVQ